MCHYFCIKVWSLHLLLAQTRLTVLFSNRKFHFFRVNLRSGSLIVANRDTNLEQYDTSTRKLFNSFTFEGHSVCITA